MMTNQISAAAALDLWAQSGGAFDTVKTDVMVLDAERQAASYSRQILCCGPETEVAAASYTHSIQCRGGW